MTEEEKTHCWLCKEETRTESIDGEKCCVYCEFPRNWDWIITEKTHAISGKWNSTLPIKKERLFGGTIRYFYQQWENWTDGWGNPQQKSYWHPMEGRIIEYLEYKFYKLQLRLIEHQATIVPNESMIAEAESRSHYEGGADSYKFLTPLPDDEGEWDYRIKFYDLYERKMYSEWIKAPCSCSSQRGRVRSFKPHSKKVDSLSKHSKQGAKP